MDLLYRQFDGVFFEKTRLSIMTLLYNRDTASFNYIKDKLNLSDGSSYTHMEKLIKSGYIKKTRESAEDGIQTIYRLTEKGKEEFSGYLNFLQDLVKQLSTGE